MLRRLEKQLVDDGFCPPGPSVKLCLAAGKIRGDEAWLKNYFDNKGWVLWGPAYIREELRALRDAGYENTVAAVVTKLSFETANLKRRKGNLTLLFRQAPCTGRTCG